MVSNQIQVCGLRRKIHLFLFLTFVFLYRLYYFDFFVVPNTDFFAFQEQALDWLNLSLPECFKRAPLFPFVIGWLSLLFRVRHPILFAAEIFNLLLYPVSLLLIYLTSKRFLIKGAFFVPWLFALNPLVYLSNQPIVEVLLLTTILWTIYLDLKGSRFAYLAAALASITRYEAILLIPILATKAILFREERSRHFILAILSSIPIVVWMGLSAVYSPLINPYVSEIIRIGLDRDMAFGRTLLYSLTGFLEDANILIVLFVILGLLGLLSLIRTSFKEAFVILWFTLGYILIHLFYPFNFPRFAFPILWVLQLFVVKGVENLILLLNRRFPQGILPSLAILWQASYYPILILIVGVSIYILRGSIPSLLIYTGFFLSAFFSIWGSRKDLPSIAILFFLSFFAIENVIATTRHQEWIRYEQAHWRRIGEWYELNAKEGDRMALTLPSHVHFYTTLSKDYFVSLSSFKANTLDEFIEELREREITYVAWDSTYGFSPHDPYGFKSHLIFELRDGQNRPNFKLIAFIVASPPWITPPQCALIYRFIPDPL